MKNICCSVILFFCFTGLHAQTTMELEDLSAFQPQAGNWHIVSSVTMDPTVDIHEKPETPAVNASQPETPKRKRKRNQNESSTPANAVQKTPQAVTYTDGTGILLNMNNDTLKDHILTNWEHGDIELEFEVMLPKGSNSGIYLQGRYEVQLFDSWGVKQPSFSDIGGIYRNWESTPGQIYRGKAPLTNPAKAPGLWQKMHLLFQAPKFDKDGKKIKNAKFVFVDLNGIRIHENVEVPLPTGGPIEKNEVEKGPLMIQGDHGPVALRNIKYRLLSNTDAQLKDLTFQAYTEQFQSINDFTDLEPTYQGKSKDIDAQLTDAEDEFATIHKGNIEIKTADTYTFTLGYTGGVVLRFNNESQIDYQSPTARGERSFTVDLDPGTYPIEIYNYKSAGWMPPRLGLFVKGSATYPKALHNYGSYPQSPSTAPILVDVGAKPKLHRAFIDFKGERDKRLTHTMAVGDPAGVHYVYDLSAGHLAAFWRGDFIDATPMWNNRGDGSFRTRGNTIYTFLNQPIVELNNPDATFPSVFAVQNYQPKGYQMDKKTGMPTFKGQYRDLPVNSAIFPDETGTYLIHEVELSEATQDHQLHYKLAEGKSIKEMPDGSYAIDDQHFYIKLHSEHQPVVRKQEDHFELIVPLGNEKLSYAIIW